MIVGLASYQSEIKIHIFLVNKSRVLKSDISNVSCLSGSLSITLKEVKALLPLLNYKAPSSRTLKDKFQVNPPVASLSLSSLSSASVSNSNNDFYCHFISFHFVVFFSLLFQEVGSKKDRLDFEQFHKFYNHIMFEQNEVNVKIAFFCWEATTALSSSHSCTWILEFLI